MAQPATSPHFSSKEWGRLLHYKTDLFGRTESQVDGPGFFLDPQGKFDPAAEWRADSLALFDATLVGDARFECRFPARSKWMRARFEVPEFTGQCPAYEEFKSRLEADSVALVFASSYINSPPSAFGHVYLKLLHDNPNGTAGLSDYAVGFGAQMDGAGPFEVLYSGFAGKFKGFYNVIPFDFSLRKYSLHDKREQWIFPLAFKPEEVERLVDHLWELRQTYIYYSFLTENCAYHLATLLEAARFDLDLNRSPITTPLSMLHEVHSERDTAGSLIVDARALPSIKRTLAYQADALTGLEKKSLRTLIRSGYRTDAVHPLADTAQARVLDIAALHMDYRYGTRWITDSLLHTRKLQLMEARTPLPDYTPVRPPVDSPSTLSHYAGRVEVGYRKTTPRNGWSGDGPALYIKAMPAFHDRLDDPVGLSETAEFKVLELTVAYVARTETACFERLVLLDLFNFEPSTFLLSNTAWRASLAVENGSAFEQLHGPLNTDVFVGFGKSISESPRNAYIGYVLATTGAKWYFENVQGDPFVGLQAGTIVTEFPFAQCRFTFDTEVRYYARAGVRTAFSLGTQANMTPNLGFAAYLEGDFRGQDPARTRVALVRHF